MNLIRKKPKPHRAKSEWINNQEQHHQMRTFKEEYLDLLQKFNVEYDEKYLFEWID
jgi:hypothetical protein